MSCSERSVTGPSPARRRRAHGGFPAERCSGSTSAPTTSRPRRARPTGSNLPGASVGGVRAREHVTPLRRAVLRRVAVQRVRTPATAPCASSPQSRAPFRGPSSTRWPALDYAFDSDIPRARLDDLRGGPRHGAVPSGCPGGADGKNYVIQVQFAVVNPQERVHPRRLASGRPHEPLAGFGRVRHTTIGRAPQGGVGPVRSPLGWPRGRSRSPPRRSRPTRSTRSRRPPASCWWPRRALGGLQQWQLLVLVAASYVAWGAGLRLSLRANWSLLEQTGASTNVLSKAAHALTRTRTARVRRLAASSGYVATELAKEVPYYAGASAGGRSATPSRPPTRSCSSSGRASPRPPTSTASRCSRAWCWGGAHEAALRGPGHAGVRGVEGHARASPSAPARTAPPAAADRPDPPLGDRRRRRARRTVRPAPHGLRGRHGVRALAGVHRGLHPRPASCRCTPTRTPRRRRPGARPRRCARTPARIIHRAVERRRRGRRHVLRLGHDGRDRQARPPAGARRRGQRPVVFIGPYEHHSNELPWRESSADVVTIREDADGRVDIDHLEPSCAATRDRPLKIGSFSAASNVTGIVSDVDRLAIVLHRHGALAVLRLRGRRPVPPDRHERRPVPTASASKDAVFVSPHKFAGGPGTPGILVAKRSLLRNRVPSVPGGGTILFVSPTGHRYNPDPAIREEGGTPAIVESIRAGLVFALKEAVGTEEIRRRERDLRPPRARVVGDQPEHRDPRQPRARAARDRVARRPPPARAAALELRRRGAQRPVRDPGAQRLLLRRPLHPPHVSDRRRVVGEHGRETPARPARRQARVRARQLRLLHERGRVRLHPRGRPPGRERRLEAPAALPLRPGHRPLAPPGGPRAAAASLDGLRRASGLRVDAGATAPESALARQLDDARRIIAASSPRRPARRRTRSCHRSSSASAGSRLPGECGE